MNTPISVRARPTVLRADIVSQAAAAPTLAVNAMDQTIASDMDHVADDNNIVIAPPTIFNMSLENKHHFIICPF